jgi:hypothetical protein
MRRCDSARTAREGAQGGHPVSARPKRAALRGCARALRSLAITRDIARARPSSFVRARSLDFTRARAHCDFLHPPDILTPSIRSSGSILASSTGRRGSLRTGGPDRAGPGSDKARIRVKCSGTAAARIRVLCSPDPSHASADLDCPVGSTHSCGLPLDGHRSDMQAGQSSPGEFPTFSFPGISLAPPQTHPAPLLVL